MAATIVSCAAGEYTEVADTEQKLLEFRGAASLIVNTTQPAATADGVHYRHGDKESNHAVAWSDKVWVKPMGTVAIDVVAADL